MNCERGFDEYIITRPHPTSHFDFVRNLAAELSGGNVDLPSFPEIALRVRRILADPKSSVDQVVRVVGSEPALAARLLRISNSASLNRSGKSVNDLRTAINRIGYNMVSQRLHVVFHGARSARATSWRAWNTI